MPIVCLSADKETSSIISFEVTKDDTVDQLLKKFRHAAVTIQFTEDIPKGSEIKVQVLNVEVGSPEEALIFSVVAVITQSVRMAMENQTNAQSLSKTN